MNNEAKNILKRYIAFEGERSIDEVKTFLKAANETTVDLHSVLGRQVVLIRRKLTSLFILMLNKGYKHVEVIIDEDDEIFNLDSDSANLGKLIDGGKPAEGGKQDRYWKGKGGYSVVFNPEDKKFRNGAKMPAALQIGSEKSVMNFFDLAGIEYGQWLTQSDRANYLAAGAITLFDIAQVLGFAPQQIGMYGIVTLAFGARGTGKALAHFEPGSFAINLTRFERPIVAKARPKSYKRTDNLTESGGISSLLHEYGHALDYYAGKYIEKTPSKTISGGRSGDTHLDEQLAKQKNLTGIGERLMYAIIWEKSGNQYTPYYQRLKKIQNNGEYYRRRVEIFARSFESYFRYKMKKAKKHNTLIGELKHDAVFYMREDEVKRIEPLFDELIRALRSKIKKQP